jgi:hypothetical protein
MELRQGGPRRTRFSHPNDTDIELGHVHHVELLVTAIVWVVFQAKTNF